jgi:hypothetical protein
MALDLILKGVEWAEQGVPPEEDPEVAVAALESARELAFSREALVELTRFHKDKTPSRTVITPELATKSSERIKEVAERTKQNRVHVFEGVLDVIKLDRQAHLKDLTLKPQDYPGQTLTFAYPEELLPDLLNAFGKKVRVVVEEERSPEGSLFSAIEVEAASDEESP